MVSNQRNISQKRIPSSLSNGQDCVVESKLKNHGASSNNEQIRDRSAINLIHKSKRNPRSFRTSMAMVMAMVFAFYANMSVFRVSINDYVDQIMDEIPSSSQDERFDAPTINLRGISTTNNFSRGEVMRVVNLMNDGGYINKQYFKAILQKSKELLRSYETVYDITFPQANDESDESSDPMVTIVGDIHAQFYTMLGIFQVNGFPTTDHVYIFNGDFLDRGPRNIQTLTTLLLFKLHCPECIHFTRGNHEAEMFLGGEPKREFISHYDKEVYRLITEVIYEIPIGLILDQKLLVMHAGITGPDLTIDEIKAIPKGIDAEENELMEELLWADPMPQDGLATNPDRGIEFGQDVSKAFLDRNNLDFIIRGHTQVAFGYGNHHDGKVITIFSAPQERMEVGSYANIDSNLKLSVTPFRKYPKFIIGAPYSVPRVPTT